MTGIGTPRSHKRIPRPIMPPSSRMLEYRSALLLTFSTARRKQIRDQTTVGAGLQQYRLASPPHREHLGAVPGYLNRAGVPNGAAFFSSVWTC
jgi:hypothetical protein